MLRFRDKIMLLVGLACGGLLVVTGVALVMGQRSAAAVTSVETRYLPLLELDRDLKELFGRIPPALEGAVRAADDSLLRDADALRDKLTAKVEAGAQVIADNGAQPAEILADFRRYYDIAREVSVGMIAGRAGEDIVARIEQMRVAQQAFAERLDRSTTPDRGQMQAAFTAARAAQRDALLIDAVVALVVLVAMLLLSSLIIRGTVQALSAVGAGVQRFARGELGQPIAIASKDEFGDLAREANETGAKLLEYRAHNEREDWLKSGIAALATEITGEQHVPVLGRKALTFLARYTDAALGAAYGAVEDGTAELLDVYAYATRAGVPARFQPGEGLIGQALKDGEIRVLGGLPADYVSVRSGLGEARPSHVVIMPFGHEGRTLGVLELGFLVEVPARTLELLARVRDILGVAFDVAESRNRVQALLEETQQQAEELKEAYDVLEGRNTALELSEQRLQHQQEELTQTNEELEAQGAALEKQRELVSAQNQELRRTHTLLEERAGELARVSGYKSQFLANMSHELRTPLNSVMILSKLLAESGKGNLTPKQLDFAQIIHKSGQELLTLINDVLDLAKVESGTYELVWEDVLIADLAEYVHTMFGPLAAQKHLALEVAVADGLPAILRTDRQRLLQVLKNLLSNALKFTEEGRIGVTIAPPGPEVALPAGLAASAAVTIAVADTGIGIPADKQGVIFEAFAQADGGTSRKYGGTGLGLSIAREIVVRLGGDVAVHSAVGRGTTFTVVLPVGGVQVAAAPPERVVVPAISEPQRPVAGPPSLLVIEDDPTFAGIVLDMVREAGFVALSASTGAAGVALAEGNRPSGILLDVGLPDGDGWAVMEKLKARRATRDIPVHFLTASEDAQRAQRLGAVGYLKKPISAEGINHAIATLAQSMPAQLRTVLSLATDAGQRATLEALLRGSDVEVEHAPTGAEAAERLRTGAYGCLVIDLDSVDRGEGLALIGGLRGDARTAALPIIVWTGVEPLPPELGELAGDDRTRVILKGERAAGRILEEAQRFLLQVRTSLKNPPAPAGDAEPPFADQKVLIVDDDMRNVYSLSQALRARRLVTVVAADGQEALERLDEHPDTAAVLMDVMMPRVDGYEATRRIRQDPRFGKLPIIALTAKTMIGDRKKCFEAGASDYIPKPVDMDALVAILRVWLDGEVTPAG